MVILIIILWIWSEAYRDAEDINEGDYIKDHTSRTINRILVGIITASINPIFGVVTLLLFWGLFDTALNGFRKLPWNYVGSTASTDKFGKKYPIIYWGSKIISLIASFILLG